MKCRNCGWKGGKSDLAPIADVEQRVLSGELMAEGQCPQCGDLFGVESRDVPDYTLEACARIMLERGWQVVPPAGAAMGRVR